MLNLTLGILTNGNGTKICKCLVLLSNIDLDVKIRNEKMPEVSKFC